MQAESRGKQGKIRWVFGLLAPHHCWVPEHTWSMATYHRANLYPLLFCSSLLVFHIKNRKKKIRKEKQNQPHENKPGNMVSLQTFHPKYFFFFSSRLTRLSAERKQKKKKGEKKKKERIQKQRKAQCLHINRNTVLAKQ